MNSLFVLYNGDENWNRERILGAYGMSINLSDMALVVNNNTTFSVIKNIWGRQCSRDGFEITLPMSQFVNFVTNPKAEGSKLK